MHFVGYIPTADISIILQEKQTSADTFLFTLLDRIVGRGGEDDEDFKDVASCDDSARVSFFVCLCGR